MKNLIVIGGGEHARVVIDAARTRPDSWNLLGFVDPQECPETVSRCAIPRLADVDSARELINSYRDAFFVIGLAAAGKAEGRREIVQRYEVAGVRWATVIHRDATLSPAAVVGEGTVILARAVLNSGCRIGLQCLINTGAIVEHDVVIGDYTHIAPGAVLGGGATVGGDSYVGLGSRIRDHISLGKGVFVAMGSVVVNDVADGSDVMGVPARPRAIAHV